jgi:hypothetical protein
MYAAAQKDIADKRDAGLAPIEKKSTMLLLKFLKLPDMSLYLTLPARL